MASVDTHVKKLTSMNHKLPLSLSRQIKSHSNERLYKSIMQTLDAKEEGEADCMLRNQQISTEYIFLLRTARRQVQNRLHGNDGVVHL